MKYLVITFFLTLLQFANVLSQDLSKLDSRYGIKKFKLESNIVNYQADLSILIEGNINFYKYTGSDIKTIFNAEIEEIILGFYKNKLYYIGFVIDNTLDIYETIIYEKLTNLFGPTRGKSNFKSGPFLYSFQYIWETKNTRLTFEESSNEREPIKKTKIWMTSNALESVKDSEDF